MSRSGIRPVLATLVLTAAAGAWILYPSVARPADYTTTMSAADKDDVWDGVLGVRYEWLLRQSKISREYPCDSTEPGCPTDGGVVRRSEVDSERTTHMLDIDGRIGLYKDFELFFTLPFVLSDRTDLDFSDGVTRANSTVYPSAGPFLFEIPSTGRDRKGFGDMQVGLKVGAMNQFRNHHHPTLFLSLTYTAPTGTVRTARGGGVGEGLHKIRFELGANRRIKFFDPYFGFHVEYRTGAPTVGTLFRNWDSATQKLSAPGPELGLKFGAEFYLWNPPLDNREPARFATLDLGFSARYIFAGREYTDLFDAFGNSACAGDASCVSPTSSKNMMAYDRTGDGRASALTYMDGITDVAAYGLFSTWLGINVQPIKYVALGFRFAYAYETPHFLTNAAIGRNLDTTNGNIELTNADGKNEFSPVFNSDVDAAGNRFYSEGAHTYGIMLMISGKY